MTLYEITEAFPTTSAGRAPLYSRCRIPTGKRNRYGHLTPLIRAVRMHPRGGLCGEFAIRPIQPIAPFAVSLKEYGVPFLLPGGTHRGPRTGKRMGLSLPAGP